MENDDLKENLIGRFLVLDGPDGCGKTIQAELLSKRFANMGIPTQTFRDPGDTIIGEKIRKLLLSPEHIAMSTRTELLLYMAARAQLWHERIVPVLRERRCVILDRWLSSTVAYQGYAGGFGVEGVIKLAMDSLDRPWPDLTIILDIDLRTMSKRLSGRPDRMEAKPRDYHKKVREGFLKLAEQREDFFVVDARRDINQVHEKVLEVIENFFSPHVSQMSLKEI